jgi:hypothetical protein
VTLTALPVVVDRPPPEPAPEPPEVEELPVPRSFWAKLFRRPLPEPPAPPGPPEPVDASPLPAIDAATGAAVLGRALDTLGAAHHRPFSR